MRQFVSAAGLLAFGLIAVNTLSLASSVATPSFVLAEPGIQIKATEAATMPDMSITAITPLKYAAVSYSGGTATSAALPITTWATKGFYVDPLNKAAGYARNNPGANGAGLIAQMGAQPVATWFGGWNKDVQGDVNTYISGAAASGTIPVMVLYNIPNRDCGGYSSGGAASEAEYNAWIQKVVSGVGGRSALVILEPDAVPQNNCFDNDPAGLTARYRMLSNAVSNLTVNGNVKVYIDAGHADWVNAQDTANRLKQAGVNKASGFSLNVSNFRTTQSNIDFGNKVSALTGGKHYVIDTSRNGNGPNGNEWCNPAGRALGQFPTTQTKNALADAFLWIKTPWDSDGSCKGAPEAGQPHWDYAVGLARAAGW